MELLKAEVVALKRGVASFEAEVKEAHARIFVQGRQLEAAAIPIKQLYNVFFGETFQGGWREAPAAKSPGCMPLPRAYQE